VIDTVGIKTVPHGRLHGTPHSDALDVVERYRLIGLRTVMPAARERNERENIRFRTENAALEVDPNYRGKHLQLEYTVEDETVFTVPVCDDHLWTPVRCTGRIRRAENRFWLYATRKEANCEQAAFLSGNRRTRRVKTNWSLVQAARVPTAGKYRKNSPNKNSPNMNHVRRGRATGESNAPHQYVVDFQPAFVGNRIHAVNDSGGATQVARSGDRPVRCRPARLFLCGG
jgi:hypothetical protein